MAETIQIAERLGLGLAIVQARKGVDADAIGRTLGIDLRDGPGRIGDASLSTIGTGPGSWFVLSEQASDDWAERIAVTVKGLASVFDQSSGHCVLSLSGPDARTLLQAGAPVDLDPLQFPTGASASTLIAHIAVLLWRTGEDSFDLAFYRSYRESLERWLTDAVRAL